MILGIDEVGRGAWAGPLVVGAVVLGDTPIEGLTDSKLLTKQRRESLDVLIRQSAAGYGLGWVTSSEIDQIGLAQALRLATIRAVEQITTSYHEIIIDGTINFLSDTVKGQYVTLLKKADLLIPSVSAASIIAKVARDQYMTELDEVHPDYGFSRHVGYGTALHRRALAAHGSTVEHRHSFAPLKQVPVSQNAKPSPTSVGMAAEEAVANYLTRRGHTILERNWKTRWCEIDIISLYDDVLYFTEVKYRSTDQQGGGVAAITPKKLKQMSFACESFVQSTSQLQTDRCLAFAEVGSEPNSIYWQAIDMH